MVFGRALTAQAAGVPSAALVTEAARAAEDGRPYRATRLLLPALAGSAGRDPAVLLLAARAAAGWQGWSMVARLLAPEQWLDGREDGEGRALLARARVERGEDAVDDARRALATATSETLGPRLVTLGRAFDRINLLDSAAAAYLRAASFLPSIRDWLRLRAAGVLADSAGRAAIYRSVSLGAALPRVRWTEALARERTGDLLGAARWYDALGAVLSAIRLRIRTAQDSTALAAVRRILIGLFTPRLSAEDSRDAIALLDASFPRVTAVEELQIARRAVAVDLPRAAAGFARASEAHPLAESDRLTYGTTLARLGRHREAMALLAEIKSRELRAQAGYLRARSLLAVGRRADAIAALRRVATKYSEDSVTSATAGFLVADLLVDDHDESGARRAYLDVAHRFPRTSHGLRASFQAALLRFLHGSTRGAAQEFASLAERAADRTEGVAALYWSGRALFAAGDSGAARARWRTLVERFPYSYYALPAAERLGAPAVPELPPAIIAGTDTSLLAALDRGALLDRLGLHLEARFEYDRLSREAENARGVLLATAKAYLERGLVARGYRLALRASEGIPQRLAFPLSAVTGFAEEARQGGVDPLLGVAVIRQESAFDPFARSAADARGLMQVLPSLGASLARAEGIRDWDPSLLYEPEINVHFGMAHLAQSLQRYPRLSAALAAYNAGTHPADQWLALPGAEDPDVFIERIQFAETRDYVRRVLRNLSVYHALYPVVP